MLGSGKHIFKIALGCSAVLGPVGLVGCGSDEGGHEAMEDRKDFGSVEVALRVGDDVVLNEVHFGIAGSGFEKSGSATVTKSNKLQLRVGGIPAGEGYEITLSAVDATDSAIVCEGVAHFDIVRGQTTQATVHLMCRLPRNTGSVVINGEFNVCPLIEELSLLPSEVEVGGVVDLIAIGSDSDEQPDALSYQWSSNSGQIADADEAITTLLCTHPGEVTVTLSVTDGDCEDAMTTTVTCTEEGEEEPGEAILVWNEVESNGGVPDDWAELYNAGDAAQDLSGWTFKDNDDGHVYLIPSGTSIAPGEYLVLENYGFGLGSPDSVRLFDPAQNLVASYSWGPHAPTTYGRCPDVTGEFGITTSSTKGAPNDCSPTVLINEVESSGGEPGDWVELFNPGLNTNDLTGWVLKDNDDSHAYVLPQGTSIAPGEYLLLDEADLGFGLGGSDSARLFDASGTLVDSYDWAAHAATTYGRCPNGGGGFQTTSASTKGSENACAISIKLNEVESNGGTPGDWVEILNSGLGVVALDGWTFKDSDDTHVYVIPAGTSIAPGEHLVLEEAAFDFGLGGGDSARLFDAAGVLVDSYTWAAHAPSTYGRCPDGSGDFIASTSSKGALNDCPLDPNVPAPWPGAAEVQSVDSAGAFPGDLSGLHYQPGSPSVLWAAVNGEGRVHRLLQSAGTWTPEAGDWSTGKLVTYPSGTGEPDSEGLTKAERNAAGLYLATERDNDNSGVSRLSVLRVDETAAGSPLVASHEWNLNAMLPAVGANLGLEAITWIPDSTLLANGFFDSNLGHLYDPADYPDHGTGLFVVGVEGTGNLHVLALDHATGTAALLATVPSGFAGVMSLEFDRETHLLWAGCDNTCGNQLTVLEIASGGALEVTGRFSPPAELPNTNNEGLAFQSEAECTSGLKQLFWADDAALGGHALRQGNMPCGVFF